MWDIASLYADGSLLVHGDFGAGLSGEVCGVFVGIAAGGAFGMHWQNLIIGNICDILTHA